MYGDMMHNNPQPILAPELSALQQNGIVHGFFTRKGGVSQGIYQSLNVGRGSGDCKAHVTTNRHRVADSLGVADNHLVTVHQIHSADVATVDAPFTGMPAKADAMVTNKTGLALGVLTADCGPVLFADDHARIVGAAHAGWRGALNGVLENTVAAMEKLGARREHIVAVLGPAIGPKHYEVGAELHSTFTQADPAYKSFFTATARPDHFTFNLWSFITNRLKQSGVQASSLALCTYADESCFFSYRRKTHRGETDYGRQISAIVLGKE